MPKKKLVIDLASNAYDNDWIRAARLEKEAKGKGAKARAARAKLKKMQETKLMTLEEK